MYLASLLLELHERVYSMTDKVREEVYTTPQGIKVTEKEYESGNIRIIMEKDDVND